MTGKQEKDLLEKAVSIKRFEYSPLGKEIKAQTDIAKNQYQKLGDTYDFDKIIRKENPIFKKCNRSNMIYDSKYSFYAYHDINKINSLFLKSKYPIFLSFHSDLNKFHNLNPRKGRTKDIKATVYDNALELSI